MAIAVNYDRNNLIDEASMLFLFDVELDIWQSIIKYVACDSYLFTALNLKAHEQLQRNRTDIFQNMMPLDFFTQIHFTFFSINSFVLLTRESQLILRYTLIRSCLLITYATLL